MFRINLSHSCLILFDCLIGILLFLVEIAILCWVKFWFKDHTVAWVATGLLIPILLIFVGFAAHFYLKLVAHKSEVSFRNIMVLLQQLHCDENLIGDHYLITHDNIAINL